MKALGSSPLVLLALLTLAKPAAAQGVYLGAGLGYTVALNGMNGARNFEGTIGYEASDRLGLQLDGVETTSVFFLTGNARYGFGSKDEGLRFYLVGGLGLGIDLSKAEFVVDGGPGFLIPLSAHARLFIEARLYHAMNSKLSRPTILPMTLGLQVRL